MAKRRSKRQDEAWCSFRCKLATMFCFVLMVWVFSFLYFLGVDDDTSTSEPSEETMDTRNAPDNLQTKPSPEAADPAFPFRQSAAEENSLYDEEQPPPTSVQLRGATHPPSVVKLRGAAQPLSVTTVAPPSAVGQLSIYQSIPPSPLASQSQPPAPTSPPQPDKLALGRRTPASEFWRATPAEMIKSDDTARARRARVLEVFNHAWKGYKQKAFGYDEIKPTSGQPINSWGGIGMTILDTLDTLWIMGLHADFKEATAWVQSSALDFSRVGDVSVFETTIRALGGLLSAHALSGEAIFVKRARELGMRLKAAFGHNPTGLAAPWMSLVSSQPSPGKDRTTVAEAGTLQLEFARLSDVTGENHFRAAAAQAHEFFYKEFKKPGHGGLFPVHINLQTGQFSGQPSWGAEGDSFYEYLLKCWLAQGSQDSSPLLEMYEAAVRDLQNQMIHRSTANNLAYVSGRDNRMEHLACFLPGLLALGAHKRPKAPNRKQEFQLAEDLARTCHEMYARHPTGMAPEAVKFQGSMDFEADKPYAMWSILRPETAESYWILHELTGDHKYRDWGHEMLEAIDRSCRTTFGYGAHPDVTSRSAPCCKGNDDKEASFFFAETLKYLYLLQDPDHQISLDSYVLNTEAHPFPLPR